MEQENNRGLSKGKVLRSALQSVNPVTAISTTLFSTGDIELCLLCTGPRNCNCDIVVVLVYA